MGKGFVNSKLQDDQSHVSDQLEKVLHPVEGPEIHPNPGNGLLVSS